MTSAEIVPGVFRIESAMGSRRLAQWLLVGSEGALLFDTGIAGTVTGTIAPALSKLGIAAEQVTEIVASHADVDHYGGNAEARRLFGSARLRAHPFDRPLIESWDRISRERYGWYRDYGLDYPPAAWEWLRDAAGPDVELDGTVEEGERIELGGLTVEVLHLPGHSRGHLGLLEPASGTAIIADAAMGPGFPDRAGKLLSPPPYLDVSAYRATIERLRSLAPTRLGTAHFPLMEGAAVTEFLGRSATLVDELERALEAALGSRPLALAELLSDCGPAVGPYPEMEVELSRSLGAHLEALSQSGAVARVEGAEAPAWRRA